MSDPRIAEQARRNGGQQQDGANGRWFATRLGPLGELGRDSIGIAGEGLGRVARGAFDAARDVGGRGLRGAVRRIGQALTADLDDRDPDYIRENLPLSWLVASLWYRAEVRNLGNIPERGPVLLVGNHTGGNLAPETIVFTLAFSTYFGVERRYHQLAHNLVLISPLGRFLRKYGTVAASHENARKALEADAAVLVFPGGDWEVHRPTWEGNRIDFGGRKGFIRLALEQNVPIVPVVTIGGQETAIFLSRGAWLARALGLDRRLRLKVLPILLAPPWGISIGDFVPRVPLPAKITIEVLPAVHLRERFGDDPDSDEVYTHVTELMQQTLDGLAAERTFPIIG